MLRRIATLHPTVRRRSTKAWRRINAVPQSAPDLDDRVRVYGQEQLGAPARIGQDPQAPTGSAKDARCGANSSQQSPRSAAGNEDDAATFPAATVRYIMALWPLLGHSADVLAKATPGALDATIALDDMERRFMPHLTAIVSRVTALMEPDLTDPRAS